MRADEGEGQRVPVSPASSLPPSPASTNSKGAGSGSRNRDEGAQYLQYEELPPFQSPPEERAVLAILARLDSSTDWAEQFGAIDDARRLVKYAPRALANVSHLRKCVALITTLVDSLRSALAKNALRCAAELFMSFGRRMDQEVDLTVPVILRRAADTNSFIAEEAEAALREVCKVASEPKLLPVLVTSAGHRRAEIRARAVWCLAMLGQRLGARGEQRDLRGLADAVGRALADANAEVRQAARVAVIALAASGGLALLDCPLAAKLSAAVPPGANLSSFDAFDLGVLQRGQDFFRTAPQSGTSAMSGPPSPGYSSGLSGTTGAPASRIRATGLRS